MSDHTILLLVLAAWVLLIIVWAYLGASPALKANRRYKKQSAKDKTYFGPRRPR